MDPIESLETRPCNDKRQSMIRFCQRCVLLDLFQPSFGLLEVRTSIHPFQTGSIYQHNHERSCGRVYHPMGILQIAGL